MRSLSFSARRVHAFVLFVVVVAVSGISLAGEGEAGIEIVANPKSGTGPMWVYIEPRVNDLKEPLKFTWSFGDGKESAEMIPKPHYYDFGKFNLVLEVTDKEGKGYTASVTIDAVSPG